MSAIDITFPGNLAQVTSAADLAALPSATLDNGDLYTVSTLGALFAWSSSSLAADDGQSVIRPLDLTPLQAGRWVLGSFGLYSSLLALKANAIDLAASTGAALIGTSLGITVEAAVNAPTQFNASIFNIVGDGGVSDQTVKMQTMLTAMGPGGSHQGQTAVMPADKVMVSANLAASGMFHMRGQLGASAIIFKNNAQIVYTGGPLYEHIPPKFTLRDMILYISGGVHTSGPLVVGFGANATGSTAKPFLIENVEVLGLTETDGFATAISCNNVPNGVIRGLRGYGDRRNFASPVLSGKFLSITADVGSSTGAWLIDRLDVSWCDEAAHFAGHCEGLAMQNWNIVGVRHGVTGLDDGHTINLLAQMSCCYIDASSYAYYFRNWSSILIDKTNQFQGDKIPNEVNATVWQGGIVEVVNPASQLNLTYDIEGQYMGDSSPAAQRVGTQVNGSTGNGTPGHVHGYYQGCSTAIYFAANSKGALAWGAKFLGTSNTNNIVDMGTGNTVGGTAATGPNFILNGI